MPKYIQNDYKNWYDNCIKTCVITLHLLFQFRRNSDAWTKDEGRGSWNGKFEHIISQSSVVTGVAIDITFCILQASIVTR